MSGIFWLLKHEAWHQLGIKLQLIKTMFICWFCLKIFSNYHFTQMASYFMGNEVWTNEGNPFWAQRDVQAVAIFIVTKYLNYLELIVNYYCPLFWQNGIMSWCRHGRRNLRIKEREMLRIRGRRQNAGKEPRVTASSAVSREHHSPFRVLGAIGGQVIGVYAEKVACTHVSIAQKLTRDPISKQL